MSVNQRANVDQTYLEFIMPPGTTLVAWTGGKHRFKFQYKDKERLADFLLEQSEIIRSKNAPVVTQGGTVLIRPEDCDHPTASVIVSEVTHHCVKCHSTIWDARTGQPKPS